MKHFCKILLGLSLCLSLHAQADTISLQSGSTLAPNMTGHTMDQIVHKLGEPAQRHSAVGDPPITRWQYENQTVYFEQDRVIHSVQHR